MYGYVYIIKNIVNDKLYVGQTIANPITRWKNHLSTLKSNNHDNEHLQNSFNKYGIDNFKFHILNWANNQEELDKLEIYYIKNFDCLNRDKGYNMLPGGLNSKHTDETKKKIGAGNKGKILSDETKEKLRQVRTGLKFPLEMRRKNSKSHWNKEFPGATFLRNKNPERKCWRSRMKYKRKNKTLAFCEDPYTASLIYFLVWDEIYNN